MTVKLKKIQEFAGTVNKEQLRFVDAFVSENASIFIPVAGPCYYATTEHTHPAYMFVYSFNNETKLKIGRKLISVPPRHLCVFSPQIKHQELSEETTPRYIAILIKKNYFEKQLTHYSLKRTKIFKGEFSLLINK